LGYVRPKAILAGSRFVSPKKKPQIGFKPKLSGEKWAKVGTHYNFT
jgi:hypothetical protein